MTKEITTEERRKAIKETFDNYAVTIRGISIKSFFDHKTAVIKLYPFENMKKENKNYITVSLQFADSISNGALCLGMLRVFQNELQDYIDGGEQNFSDSSIMNSPQNNVTNFLMTPHYNDDSLAEDGDKLEDTYSIRDLLEGLRMVTAQLNHLLFSVASTIYVKDHGDLIGEPPTDVMHNIVINQFVKFVKREWLADHDSIVPDACYASLKFENIKKFVKNEATYEASVVFGDKTDAQIKELQAFILDGFDISEKDRKEKSDEYADKEEKD